MAAGRHRAAVRFDTRHFARGVDDILFLRPLRKAVSDALGAVLAGLTRKRPGRR